jgi:methylated-DNA-[protein]-cysteine S-methyltransferase
LAQRDEDLAIGYVTTWAGETRVVASPAGVRATSLPEWREGTRPQAGASQCVVERAGDPAAERQLRQALDELAAYFAGTRCVFSVALDLGGTPFYRRAWEAVAQVPYGETNTYAEIACAIGAPAATRAVGVANGANPVAPLVPCHRIVGSDGALTGYGPGLPLKRRLLVMEGALPAGPDSYAAWLDRVGARLGTTSFYLGLRGARVYCRPDCSRARAQWSLPARTFASAAEAATAGFAPCERCSSRSRRA